jgi:aminoglycoside 3-N-acetyltransferase I
MLIERLTTGDRDRARSLFRMMADVFEDEEQQELDDAWIDRLLAREDFWALGAYHDGEVLGGLTAHTLPMTRRESSEIFIYDLAVREDRQRQGVGRLLVTALRDAAAGAGIEDVFVPADNDDTHALDFYRALGGVPTEVVMFTFEGPPR